MILSVLVYGQYCHVERVDTISDVLENVESLGCKAPICS